MRSGRDPNSVRRRLARLAEMVQAVECRGGGGGDRRSDVLATGWPEMDDALASPFHGGSTPTGGPERPLAGGLMRGAVHEWLGLEAHAQTSNGRGSRRWTPALCVLSHLAWRALMGTAKNEGDSGGGGGADAEKMRAGGGIVWIGRAVWPYPRVLLRGGPGESGCSGQMTASVRDRLLLERSLFIDPPDDAMRLWAIDLALRCPAITAVIADGSRLHMAHTRRLQLAAEAGGVPALLARPPHEINELSAAATRWAVAPAPSPGPRPRWAIELLRCKGMCSPSREVKPEREINGHAAGTSRLNNPEAEHPRKARSEPKAGTRRWMLEWDHAKGVIAVPADVADRPGQASKAAGEDRCARAGTARRAQRARKSA